MFIKVLKTVCSVHQLYLNNNNNKKTKKTHVLHFQEFIQGKSTLLLVLAAFLLSLYIRFMGHLTLLSEYYIFTIDYNKHNTPLAIRK